MIEQNQKDKVISDLLRPIRLTNGFKAWMGLLTVAFVVCMGAYVIQLKEGLVVTGLRDYVSWGMYISNFVFFVATSLIGMLISAVLSLSGQKWAAPLARIAEIIALAFAAVAGLVIISDMGRPDRLLNVAIYGRVQSPIVWDITVVTVYVLLSTLFLYIPLIPDLKICAERIDKLHPLAKKAYHLLSLNWIGSEEQKEIIKKLTRAIAVFIVPVAFAIHTVTSWLFANTSRVGWDSTIFGPYFITGAFVSGTSAIVIAMYFFRRNYKLEDYITLEHFDKVGKLLVLVSLVYLYFNLNEYMVPGYKMKKFDVPHLMGLFTGSHALMFWSVQLLGLVIPIILLVFKNMRKPIPLLIIASFVFIAGWFKRYIIVVPTMEHPYLPIQNVPLNFKVYTPTLIEILVTMAPFILVLLIVSTLAKIVPIISIHETIEELEEGHK